MHPVSPSSGADPHRYETSAVEPVSCDKLATTGLNSSAWLRARLVRALLGGPLPWVLGVWAAGAGDGDGSPIAC